jgi:hypothetical protein
MALKLRIAGRDEAVGAEGGDAGADPQQTLVLADALPDQPGAADLGDRGEDEQQSGSSDRRGVWS